MGKSDMGTHWHPPPSSNRTFVIMFMPMASPVVALKRRCTLRPPVMAGKGDVGTHWLPPHHSSNRTGEGPQAPEARRRVERRGDDGVVRGVLDPGAQARGLLERLHAHEGRARHAVRHEDRRRAAGLRARGGRAGKGVMQAAARAAPGP